MITKEEVQKYISILKEVPDAIGEIEGTQEYNTRYIGQWGVYVFVYLPIKVADAIKADLVKADEKGGKRCRKVSHQHHLENHRFVCTLSKGHEGLCVGGSSNNEVSAIFEPDEETDLSEFMAEKVASKLVELITDKVLEKAKCDD